MKLKEEIQKNDQFKSYDSYRKYKSFQSFLGIINNLDSDEMRYATQIWEDAGFWRTISSPKSLHTGDEEVFTELQKLYKYLYFQANIHEYELEESNFILNATVIAGLLTSTLTDLVSLLSGDINYFSPEFYIFSIVFMTFLTMFISSWVLIESTIESDLMPKYRSKKKYLGNLGESIYRNITLQKVRKTPKRTQNQMIALTEAFTEYKSKLDQFINKWEEIWWPDFE